MYEAFAPKDGVRAEWEKVYELLRTRVVGDVITYDELSDVLGRAFATARGPFYKANTALLENDQRGLLNIKGVGYRVIPATEHEIPARRQHTAARRRMRTARRWITNANRAELSPTESRRFDEMELNISRHEQMLRRLDRRQDRLDRAIHESRQEVAGTQEQIDDLKAALRRHGIEAQ